jgi:hypothetical protein
MRRGLTTIPLSSDPPCMCALQGYPCTCHLTYPAHRRPPTCLLLALPSFPAAQGLPPPSYITAIVLHLVLVTVVVPVMHVGGHPVPPPQQPLPPPRPSPLFRCAGMAAECCGGCWRTWGVLVGKAGGGVPVTLLAAWCRCWHLIVGVTVLCTSLVCRWGH